MGLLEPTVALDAPGVSPEEPTPAPVHSIAALEASRPGPGRSPLAPCVARLGFLAQSAMFRRLIARLVVPSHTQLAVKPQRNAQRERLRLSARGRSTTCAGRR